MRHCTTGLSVSGRFPPISLLIGVSCPTPVLCVTLTWLICPVRHLQVVLHLISENNHQFPCIMLLVSLGWYVAESQHFPFSKLVSLDLFLYTHCPPFHWFPQFVWVPLLLVVIWSGLLQGLSWRPILGFLICPWSVKYFSGVADILIFSYLMVGYWRVFWDYPGSYNV